jgi:cytoskeletal protein RodZ
MNKTKKLKILIVLVYCSCFLFLITDVFIFYAKTTDKTKVSQDSAQETPQLTSKHDPTTNTATNTADEGIAVPIALSATAEIPQVTDEGSTPDNCYLHVKTPYTIRGSGDVRVTNVETTNFPDFGPFSDSIDISYKGTVTNDVSEKSAWYGNQGVVVYFHLEIHDQQGVLLTSSPIVPFTCP